jgi:5-methylcytosine-specific restriction protein A
MPKRPPVFRPPGWRERKPWQLRDGRKDRRKRGRAGMRERAQVLAEEPFCRSCLAAGLHVRAAVVDHVIPLAWDGSDERWNKQALCTACHDAKSAAERTNGPPADIARQAAKLKADWLASRS